MQTLDNSYDEERASAAGKRPEAVLKGADKPMPLFYLFLLCTHNAIPVKESTMLLNLLVKFRVLEMMCERR